MRHRGRTGLAAVVFVATTACAHHDVRRVEGFVPLAVGNEWVYAQTGFGSGTHTVQLVREVAGDRGEHRFLVDGTGEAYYLYDPKTDAIAFAASPGIWAVFLQGPLVLGARFSAGLTTNEGFHSSDGDTGIVARRADEPMIVIPTEGYKVVTSFDRSVTVPAGTFPHCLEITHLAGHVVGVKYFARDVGMVLSEGWADARGRRQIISRQELVSYRIAGKSK